MGWGKITKTIIFCCSIFLVFVLIPTNIDSNTSQIMALGVVPGISYKIAECIIKRYNTLSDLFDTYQGLESEDEKKNLLKD